MSALEGEGTEAPVHPPKTTDRHPHPILTSWREESRLKETRTEGHRVTWPDNRFRKTLAVTVGHRGGRAVLRRGQLWGQRQSWVSGQG